MRFSRVALFALLAIALLIVIGHISGNQPDRDAVAAAEDEIGLDLESRHVDVGEVTLHVVLAGPENGPPVVLLHGFPEFWYAWRGPLAMLARAGFRVIAPDQRGYNASDKPSSVDAYRIDLLADDISALIETLGYESAFLAAHDWGGGVAWNLVIRHRERVRRLVIIDTPHPQAVEGFESDEDTITWYRTFIQLPWIPGFVVRLANWRLLTRSLRSTARPGAFPDEAMDLYRSAWDNGGAITTMGHWYRAAFRHPTTYADEQRVTVPTLIILAPDDAFIPAGLSRRSLRFLDQGELLELEQGTHWIIQEEPELMGQTLIEFFRRDL